MKEYKFDILSYKDNIEEVQEKSKSVKKEWSLIIREDIGFDLFQLNKVDKFLDDQTVGAIYSDYDHHVGDFPNTTVLSHFHPFITKEMNIPAAFIRTSLLEHLGGSLFQTLINIYREHYVIHIPESLMVYG